MDFLPPIGILTGTVNRVDWRVWTFVLTTLLVVGFDIPKTAIAFEPPSAKLALSLKPIQSNVEIDLPTAEETDACKVEVERLPVGTGWGVYGPQGQPLRRFLDTNADNKIDQWSYYLRGLEVYRDLDTNANDRADQSRWINSGGSRWGIDKNEDGKIDAWKMISAEEVSKVAIEAIIDQDVSLLSTLFVTADECRELGLKKELSDRVLQNVADPSGKLKLILGTSRVLTTSSRWVRFDTSMLMPNLVPADDSKTTKDLVVYENVMAIVENGGKTGFVQMGEFVKVGDVWKMTQFPKPMEGDTLEVTEGGLLMQPSVVSGGVPEPSTVDPAVKGMIDELQQLDNATQASSKGPTPDSVRKRIDLLSKLVRQTSGASQTQWQQQLIDEITAAIQTGNYPDGLVQLAAIEKQITAADPDSELIPYILYRRLSAEYNERLRNPSMNNEQRQELQEWWLKQLQSYATTYTQVPDAADAMYQLAMTQEFVGKTKEAQSWYQKILIDHKNSVPAQRAIGALRRMSLVNNPINISYPTLQGKPFGMAAMKGRVVLVLFWSTWCQPCAEDLPQLKELYRTYGPKGFEIVGINLDSDRSLVEPFLKQQQIPWLQLFEEGGLDSKPATDYGVISLPTMFLVDKSGVVISNTSSVEELKEKLPELLK